MMFDINMRSQVVIFSALIAVYFIWSIAQHFISQHDDDDGNKAMKTFDEL